MLSFFGLSNLYDAGLVYATSTVFVADHLTDYDIFVASTTAAIAAYNSSASTTATLAGCQSFVIADCLNYIFIRRVNQ